MKAFETLRFSWTDLKGALSGLRQFLATDAFYFTSKALFFLKIFKFLSWLFGHVAKRLDKTDKVNFNQTMKVGQLIECNMRNISFEKSYTNVMEKLVPDPLLRNYNWAYLWINDQEFYTVCFYCTTSEGCRNILKLRCTPLAFTFY